MTIAFREGLKLQPNVIDQFVEATRSDIRQILNLLSTYRLSRTNLALDESKKVYPSHNPINSQSPPCSSTRNFFCCNFGGRVLIEPVRKMQKSISF